MGVSRSAGCCRSPRRPKMHKLFGRPTRRGCRRECGGTAHAGFKLDALEQALHNRQPLDCGSSSITAIEASVGDSYDNALAETINGLYKAEVIRRREPWRSFEAVEFATLKIGRLVQQSLAHGAHRRHPAGRGRGALLRLARRQTGSMTQTKRPLAKPGRFTTGPSRRAERLGSAEIASQ